jgi:RNA polymerase sigma factor (sigma-70 family)
MDVALHMPSAALLATIERQRKRVWGLCYRMTGSRLDADDLGQEAIARAIEREDGLIHRDGLDGWLLRIATTVCLDHLRRNRIARRATELVDPVEIDAPGTPNPEVAAILRDDVRFAVMVALQHLSARQRAALLLYDVFDRPLTEVAGTLGTNPNAAKALLARARAALVSARRHTDVDVPVDPAVVDRLVRAIQSRSVDAFTALLADDVWGITDGGGVLRVASKPVFGVRAVSRGFASTNRRQPLPIAARVSVLNGERAVVVTVPSAADLVMAAVHVETRRGQIVALRVGRDARRIAHLMGEKGDV